MVNIEQLLERYLVDERHHAEMLGVQVDMKNVESDIL